MRSSKPTLLVTGGGRGIGAAVVRLAAASGYDVVFTFQSDEAAASSIEESVRKTGGSVKALRCDVSRDSEVQKLFQTIDERGNGLDALVNNAGVNASPHGMLVDADLTNIRRVIEVNLLGLLYVSREAIRRMSKDRGGKGGAIVNISSVAASNGAPNTQVWYAASKGAADTLTIGLSRELGSAGIRVNAVSPGLIATGSQQRLERLTTLLDTVPLRRLGEPEDVAEAVLWLLSDQASYVTGANLRVSGGR